MGERRAKIVATLGPSSDSVEKIKELINAGINVARVNMSHGTHEGHAQVIKNIRQASDELDREVAILLDLQGPKIRVDKLPEPLELKKGETWVIGQSEVITKYPQYKDCFIPTIYDKLVEDSHVGARILFDDGLLEAKAIEKDGEVLKIEVIVGGALKSNKGINLPDCNVSAPSLTEKDHADMMFGLQQGIDYIALSFVRRKEDIQDVKSMLHRLKVHIPIVSKVEKPEAVENIDEIIEVSDVILIARGDMGVEVGNHLVPSIQKDIIDRCNKNGVPVITATQMLESMVTNSKPTRAEASDVANAIWDGTDAVMLSGETAAGSYPIEAVTMMDQIVIEAERTPKERPLMRYVPLKSISASTQVAASLIAEKIKAKMIICVTQSGNSAKKISRFRSYNKILGVTNSKAIVRKMCLYWGVTPYYFKEEEGMDSVEFSMIDHIKRKGLVHMGDRIVITRGDGKFFSRGTSNSIKVEIIKDAQKMAGSSDGFDTAEFSKGKIHHDLSVCASCQNCISICPYGIWENKGDEARVDVQINKSNVEKCALDGECVNACPTGAIEIIPKFS